jgi:hypothetical protein
MAYTIARSPTADARATGRRVILPVMRGVVGIWFPQTTAAHAVYNWCDGEDAAEVAGSPTYGGGYFAVTDQNARLQTAIADQAALTFYVAAKSSSAFSASTSRPTIIGTYQSQASGIAGAAIQVTGTPSAAPAATVVMTAARDVGTVPTQSNASITVSDFSIPTLLVGACDNDTDTDARRIYDKTNGTSAVAGTAPATARLLSTGPNIRIGGITSLGYGQLTIYAAVVANVAHTAAEIEQNAIAIRRRLAAFHSITV